MNQGTYSWKRYITTHNLFNEVGITCASWQNNEMQDLNKQWTDAKMYAPADLQAKAELCQCVPQSSCKTLERPTIPFKIITVWSRVQWICAILWGVPMSNKMLITNLHSQGATSEWHILQHWNEWQMTQHILVYLPSSTGAQVYPKMQ